jgi:hypothetical protein
MFSLIQKYPLPADPIELSSIANIVLSVVSERTGEIDFSNNV